MSTLLLRFAGMQSWGRDATQRWRPTDRIPTLSAVTGMLNAALGVPRGAVHAFTEDIRVLVRVDRAGTVQEDYHTVTPPPTDVAWSRQREAHLSARLGTFRGDWVVPVGDGRPWTVGNEVNTMVTRRLFLADAEFMVAIESPRADTLAAAVSTPVYSPFLGRRAYAPTFPFHLGLRQASAESVLTTLPSTTPGLKPLHALEADRPKLLRRVEVPLTARPLEDWM